MSLYTFGGYALTVTGYFLGGISYGIAGAAFGVRFDQGGGFFPSMTYLLIGGLVSGFVGSIFGCWLLLQLFRYPAAISTAALCIACWVFLLLALFLPVNGPLVGSLVLVATVGGCIAARWLALALVRFG